MRALLRVLRRTVTTLLVSLVLVIIVILAVMIVGLSSRLSVRITRFDRAADDGTDGSALAQKEPETQTFETKNQISDTSGRAVGVVHTITNESPMSDSFQTTPNTLGNDREYDLATLSGEVPVRRFPQALIIGFGKCGTRAMLTFMSLHPNIVVHDEEIHFYTKDFLFAKGFKWYLSEMPLSYSNQITVEKSPDYVLSSRARREIYEHFPDVKLIVLVRNPVDRLVSSYLQRFRLKDPSKRLPINCMYTNPSTNQFSPNITAVDTGIYHKHLSPWLRTFPRENILVVADETLIANPLSVLKRVETFLNIPPMINELNFYFNETSGFYCSRKRLENIKPRCLTKFKGWKHPELPSGDEQILYDFYRPHNNRLFKILNETFDWEKKVKDSFEVTDA